MEPCRYGVAVERAVAGGVDAGFSGVVAVAHRDTVVYSHADGFADRANVVANTVETRFGIASGTKFFTALGIARLVEQGQVTFQSRLVDLLPDVFPSIDPAVTIHHLLTHSSGMYDYYDESANPDADEFFVAVPWYSLENPSDYLPLYRERPMVAKPGEPFRYNNGAYVTLGAVIEKVTGRSYVELIEAELLERAGMTESGLFSFNRLPGKTAAGYIELPDGGWKTNIYNLPIRGGGDGGLYTTARDLARFWHALTTDTILPSDITRTVLTPHIRIDSNTQYGYGVYIGGTADRQKLMIVGGDAGLGFASTYYPADEVSVSIFSNVTNGEERLGDAIARALDAE
ncbi:MAG: class C beta-lactamase-related serine hydrolase [Spirochaetaceae bacterium]|nr:MAG: class C beta-lactamase-related serine hydrolase [Spirochaetaceae bacterium]